MRAAGVRRSRRHICRLRMSRPPRVLVRARRMPSIKVDARHVRIGCSALSCILLWLFKKELRRSTGRGMVRTAAGSPRGVRVCCGEWDHRVAEEGGRTERSGAFGGHLSGSGDGVVASGYGGGGDFGGSPLRVRNSAFQIGRESSLTKSRVFREIGTCG